jgi:peptidoglycan/xylan/chitin deacetylase (PgdA/CDA1 family)
MEVTQEDFVRHLDWMQENGEIVTLGTALARRGEPDSHMLFVLTFDDGYRDVYEKGFPLMRDRGLPFSLYLATQSIETAEALTPGGRAEPLTWDQIGEMHSTGLVTIGAHTHRHIDLRDVEAAGIEEELEQSNALIEDRLGIVPVSFAYPWGYWSNAADGLVRARYRSAVLGGGAAVTGETDEYRINRVPIQSSDGVWFFQRKMQGGMVYEERARRRIRGYDGP